MRTVPPRSFLDAVLLALALACLFAASGCGERHRPMSGGEIQRYKLDLLREHDRELSHTQQHLFLQHPARTKAELDAALELYRERSRLQSEQERRELLEEYRKKPAGKDAGAAGGATGGPSS